EADAEGRGPAAELRGQHGAVEHGMQQPQAGDQQARAAEQAGGALPSGPRLQQGAQGQGGQGNGHGQREQELGCHGAPSVRGSASRMASGSRVPRAWWARSNSTTVKATSENEMTMAVRISACGSGLALVAMASAPSGTRGG